MRPPRWSASENVSELTDSARSSHPGLRHIAAGRAGIDFSRSGGWSGFAPRIRLEGGGPQAALSVGPAQPLGWHGR